MTSYYSVHSDYSDYRFATWFLPINYNITMMSTMATVSTMSTRVSRHCYQASTSQLLNHYDVYNLYSFYSLYKGFQGLLMTGFSHPTHSKNEENETYPLYISNKQGGEPSEEVQGISSISQPDHRNTTQLSSTTTSCVGQRLLGTPLKTGGTLKGQWDQITIVTSLKTKYRQQDRWDL